MGEARRRKLAGTTKRAIEAGEDWAGVSAAEQVDSFLARMQPDSRAILEPCISRIAHAVEAMCPAVMAPTGAGIAYAYGPQGVDDGLLVIVSSPEKTVAFTVSEWPELPSFYETVSAKAAWPLIVRALEDDDRDVSVGVIIEALVFRLGKSGIAHVTDAAAKVGSDGSTPALAVCTACTDQDMAAGAMGILKLPASIETQMRETSLMMAEAAGEA